MHNTDRIKLLGDEYRFAIRNRRLQYAKALLAEHDRLVLCGGGKGVV